jgi:hypothetical protein
MSSRLTEAIGARHVFHECRGIGLDRGGINCVCLHRFQSFRAPMLAAGRAGPCRAGRERVGSDRLIESVTERAQGIHETKLTLFGPRALCNAGHAVPRHIDQVISIKPCVTAASQVPSRVTITLGSVVLLALLLVSANTYAQDASIPSAEIAIGARPWTLDQAQEAFYNARYNHRGCRHSRAVRC